MEEEEDFLAPLRVSRPEQPALSPRAQELRAQGTIARVNMALASFGNVQPGTEAEMRRLAERQNIPLAAARAAGVDNLRRTNAMDTVANSPTVRRAFGDENRARIMADDTDQLSALDNVFNAFRTAAAPFVPGVTMLPEVVSFAQSIPRETLQAGRNVSQTQPFATAAGAIVPGAPLLPYVERAVSGAVLGGARARVQAELGDRIFFDDLTRRSAPTDVRTREEIALLTSEFERTQRAREEFGVAAWVGETVGYTGAQLAIGLLEAPPGVAAGAVGGGLIGGAITRRPEGVVTGGRIGGGLGLAASQSFFNFRQEAGLAFLEYQNMRLADGTRIDRETARGAAFVTGGINAVLETGADLLLTRLAIPGVDRLLNKPAKEVVDELLQTPAGQDALRQVASRAAQAGTVEGFTELLQEIVNVATGQTALASAEGVAALPAVGFGLGEALRQESLARAGQAGLEGVIGGAGVTVVTSPATIPLENYFRERDLRAQRQRAQTATGRIELVERAIETAGRTRLVDRDRGELAQFINEATEESPVSTIYVSLADAAQLAQEQNTTVEDIVRRMGGTAETIAAAEASGFAMEIPIGDFVASVTKTDLASAAVQIIKTNPLLYTRRELEVLATEGQEQAIAVAERLAAAAQNDVELQAGVLDVQAELERAIEPVRAQLAAAIEPVVGEAGAAQQLGRASAIPYAKIAAEGYGVIAQVLGITPREAMTRYPLRIGEMQVGPNLGQPIEEGAPVEGGPIVRAVTREIPVLPEFGTPEWTAMVQAAQDKQARGEALTTNERALINMGREDAAELTRILDRIRNGQELTPASQRFLRERGYDPVTGQRVQDETLGPEETLGQEAKSFSEAFSFSDQQVLEWYAENVTATIEPGSIGAQDLAVIEAVLKYKAKPEHKRRLARTEFFAYGSGLNGLGRSYLNAISFYRGVTERPTAAERAQTKTEQATARSLFRSMFLATRGFILTNPDLTQPIVFTGATPAHARVYQTFLRRVPITGWKPYETTQTYEVTGPDGRMEFTSTSTYFLLAPESLDLSAFTDTVNEKVNADGRTVRTTQTGYKQLAGPGRPAPGLAGRPDGVVPEPAPAVAEGAETLGAGFEGGRRGQYNIAQQRIELSPNSDFSTFLHELGHHFLEVNNKIALDLLDRQKRGEILTTRQQQHLDDMRLLLNEAIKRSGIEPGEALPESVVFQAQQEGYLGQDPIEAQEWLRAKAKGLDMSLEGRMARARAMGYDTDTVLYHGTTADFKAFGRDTYLASDRRYSEDWIEGAQDGQIKEVYIKGRKYSADEEETQLVFSDIQILTQEEQQARRRLLRNIENEEYDYVYSPINGGETLVFDPSNIRSIHAAFDPDFADSPNLLAQSRTTTDIGFASLAERALEQSARKNGVAQAWVNDLKKAGVSPEMINYILGPDFAKRQGNIGIEEVRALVSEGKLQLQRKDFKPKIATSAIKFATDVLTSIAYGENFFANRPVLFPSFQNALENLITRLDDASADTVDAAMYKNFALRGGKGYRESVYTIPKGVGSEFIDPHFHTEKGNLMHSRSQRWSVGRVFEELQSFAHQEGAKKGYKPVAAKDKPETGTPLSKTWLSALVALEVNRAAKDGERGVWFVGPKIQNGVFLKNPPRGAVQAYGERVPAALEALSQRYGIPLEQRTITVGTIKNDEVLGQFLGSLGQQIENKRITVIGFNLTPKARRAILGGGPAVLAQEGQDGAPPAPKGFAEQINEIARGVETSIPGGGKFIHKASIAEIYDAYGRKQPDAGSLEAFKARLLDAHNKGEIDLLPLDDPKSMDPALRARSAIKGDSGTDYHFVDRRRATEAPPAAPPPPPPPPPIGPAAPEGPRPEQDVIEWFNSLSFEQRRPYHEAFARMAETYFATGEAPTPRLKSLFEQFKEFMLKVYGDIQAFLGAPLSDEVRQAMDRFFIARTNVQRAEEGLGFTPAFATKPAFMSQQEWEGYQELTAQATREANGDLSARLMRDMQWLSGARSREMRRLQRQHAAERRAIREEVTAEVADKPVNRARRFIARGIGPDGQKIEGPHKLSRAAIKERYPNIDLTSFGFGPYGLITSENGLEPEVVYDLFGYESPEAFLNDLATAPKQADEIKAETDRRMLERYGETTSREALERAANEAVHSQLRGRAIHAQHMALTKAVGSRALLRENARAAAKIIVGRQPASKLNPRQAMAAERLAGRRLMTALKADDLTAAATASRDQLLAFEITAETLRQQKAYQSARALFRRVRAGKKENVAKNRNFDLVMAARAILSAFGEGTERQAEEIQGYIKAVQDYDPALYANIEPAMTAAIRNPKPLDQLSVTELTGLRDTIQSLYDLAREQQLIIVAGRTMNRETAVNEVVARLQAVTKTKPQRGLDRAPTQVERDMRAIAGLGSWLRRVESWARQADGGRTGPFTRLIWRPISQAADQYRIARNDFIARYRALFDQIAPTMKPGRIDAPEIGFSFESKSQLLHAILHTGNASNKRKLLLGYGWGTLMPDKKTVDDSRWRAMINRMAADGTLTQADFDFAQSVWDLLEETKPLAQETHRRVFGRYFNEITAETVVTPFGTYRGGYVPAIYDPQTSANIATKAELELREDSRMFPAPANDFTKNRTDYASEMHLDLLLLSGHIDKVLKFSYMAAPVRDVLSVLKDKNVSEALHAYDPTAFDDMLDPWLYRAARQVVETPTTGKAGRIIDAFGRGLRRRSGMGLMFANLVNVVQQVTSFSLAAVRVPPHRLAQGLARYMLNPKGVTDGIRAASLMMRERGDNQASGIFGEIEQIIDPNNKYKQLTMWFARHTYFMQIAFQNVIDVVVWQGAYDDATAKGETHDEAVAQADAIVRQTQSSSLPEDISRAEAGNVGLRLFTHMYNYFNMNANLLATEFQIAIRDMGLRKGAGRLLYVYFVGFAIPAVIGQIIADAMRGQLPEDEEDDGYLNDWLTYTLEAQRKYLLGFVPIVGQAVTAGFNALNDKPYDDRVGTSPAVSILESAVKTPSSVYKAIMEEGDQSRAAKDLLNAMTLLTGIPFSAASRSVGFAFEVAEGDVEPVDELDYARGLVTGSASEASKQ